MLDSFKGSMEKPIAEAFAAHSCFASVVSNKESRIAWLKEARGAQVLLAATLVLGGFIMPSLIDGLVDVILPGATQKSGLFGMSQRQVENPLAGPVSWVLLLLFWALGLATSLVLLWRRLPGHVPTASAHEASTSSHSSPREVSGVEGTMLHVPKQQPPPNAAPASIPRTIAGPGLQEEGPPPAAAPGELLSGRYLLTRLLGEGGMGQVFLAEDQTLGRRVAIKRLPSELLGQASLRERFRREARALAQLNHAHVVQLYDFLEDAGGMWMIMEVVAGGDLEGKMEAERLSLSDVGRLGSQMAKALAAAHAHGIVHRDFKPANVMLTGEGDAKVTDFGIAKLEQASAAADTKLTQAGSIMGTPTYMSPEQAMGTEVGPASDIYSLGATLYEMLSGQPVFSGTLTRVVAAHITETPRPFHELGAEVPPAMERLVVQMLDKDPGNRPDCAQIVDALAGHGLR